MRVKICGITNIKDALLCQSCGADALGFIFYKKSKRYVEPAKAAQIISALSPFILKVGVFVNEPAEVINRVAKLAGLNAVQVHSDDVNDITDKINFPVIKAYRVGEGFDFNSLLKQSTSYLLLDSFTKEVYGGSGKQFNWKMIPEKLKNRIILAGGISKDNLEEIFYTVKPAAIDLSSSLESEPGKKDFEKVKSFFNKLNELKGNLC